MENPSLRVGGHVSSTNKTFTVEDNVEDDFGQWATITFEQGHIDHERSCFWTWDDTECAWQARQGKGKGKGTSKRSGRALAKNKHKIPNGGSKKRKASTISPHLHGGAICPSGSQIRPLCCSAHPRPRTDIEHNLDLILFDHGSAKIGGKSLGFQIFFGWSHITFDSFIKYGSCCLDT